MSWLKTLPGTPALPANWVECNGQTLSDAQSPFNGAVIPNLNGAGGGAPCFLRGDVTSGATGGSDTHRHTMQQFTPTLGDADSTDQYAIPTSDLTDFGSSLPSYYGVVWILRVK